MKDYVDELEERLGIAEPGKTRVAFQPFDMGRSMGVTATFPDGRRHTVRVPFGPGWLERAELAFLDWRVGR